MPDQLANRILLIGWDAADWKIIRPLLKQGLMPNLKRLMENGAWGNLATLQPILSPMLWNSIATGKRPEKHGILGFTEPIPSGGGIRVVTSTSRKTKAVWNILTQQGLHTHALGWFASHPAEPINGVCVSNVYPHATSALGEAWPMPDDTVHPPELAETLAELRVHPGEIGADALLAFVPKAGDVDQDKDLRLRMLAKVLGETFSIHTAATWVLDNRPWEFLAVFYDAIDHFCHGFMHYHPPRRPRISDKDFELYSGVVNAAYCLHDLLLGRLLQLGGEGATVLLVSDHGFHSDHLRPAYTPRVPAGPAVWHRPIGICVAHGPGIEPGGRIYGATVLDVTPTVLSLLGLHLGEDMDGRPWREAFSHPVEAAPIPSWDEVEGECGMHPPDKREDPVEAREALKQLIDLGYIEKPNENAQRAVDLCIRERDYNLARSLLDAGRPESAAEILKKLTDEDPEAERYAVALARAYHASGLYRESRAIVESHIEKGEESAQGLLLMARMELSARRARSALAYLERVREKAPRSVGLYILLGQVYARLQQWDEAEQSFLAARDLDEDNHVVHRGLAASSLGLERPEEAVEHALQAIERAPHDALTHYYLGVALSRIERPEEAVQAFEISLAIAPQLLAARRRLAALYREQLGDTLKAADQMIEAKRIRRARAERTAAQQPVA